jgi:diguanylate cyclase (GGDEF)-like protein/PAS domain S-box-containing protein
MVWKWLQRRHGAFSLRGKISSVLLDDRLAERTPRHRDRLLTAPCAAGIVTFAVERDTGLVEHGPGMSTLVGPGSCATVDDLARAVHPEDRRAVEVFFALLRSIPRSQDEPDEIEVRTADGDRLIHFCARTEHGPDGRVWVSGVIQDVTQQRNREGGLRAELQRLADAQDVARIGTWEWVPETRLIELSDITCAITGREPGAAIPYGAYLARVFAEDRDYVEQTWRELRDSPNSEFTCEHRYHCPDGRIRVLRVHGAQVGKVRADGRRRMLGTLQDVTEQRALATKLQRFTALCQVSPLGMGIFDEATRLVEANDALCALLGYSLEQLRGLRAADLIHPTDPGELIPPPSGDIAERDSATSECTLATRTGRPVHCELHRGLTVQADGSRYWLLVFCDITERVKQAASLRHRATHDDLTGLPNRTAAKEMIASFGDAAQSTRQALLFCDVDNFKMINDTLGHSTGDAILRDMARKLRKNLPSSCTPARLHGDEFLVLCFDVDAAGGFDELSAAVSALMRTSVISEGVEIPVSASVGIAAADFSQDCEELIRAADAAMMKNKFRNKHPQM